MRFQRFEQCYLEKGYRISMVGLRRDPRGGGALRIDLCWEDTCVRDVPVRPCPRPMPAGT